MASARVIRLSEPDAALAEEARTAASLVERVRQDNEDAKAEIYERYGPGPKDEVLVEALCDLIQKNDSRAVPAEQEA